MKQTISFVSLLVIAGLIVSSMSYAATTASVTAVVTVQNISVSVTDGAINYGTLSVSATQDTTSGGVDDSQTADNDGNITEDFNIQGTDTATWELGDTIGADQYSHKFCVSDCDGTPSWTAFNEDGYTTLASSIASTSSQVFDLQLSTPSSSSSYSEQSVDVTIQAAAS